MGVLRQLAASLERMNIYELPIKYNIPCFLCFVYPNRTKHLDYTNSSSIIFVHIMQDKQIVDDEVLVCGAVWTLTSLLKTETVCFSVTLV